jgi:hypothetical protein
MASLNERIHRGEVAIASAKAMGRDVSAWEAHLRILKEQIPALEPEAPPEMPSVPAEAILAEHSNAEVDVIIDVWRRLFGFSESRERIAGHLKSLEAWQGQKRRE